MSIQLRVENVDEIDSSIARLSSKFMDRYELFCGDIIKLKGNKRKETLCVILSDEKCEDNQIKINHVVQKNLQIFPNEFVIMEICKDLVHGTTVCISLIDRDLSKDDLESFFYNAYRPVHVDDRFIIQKGEFQVIKTEPDPYCLVTQQTKIECTYEINFDDIAGLDEIKQQLKEFISYPAELQKFHSKYHLNLARGMLLYGPSGCGKTMLVKALATECKMNLITFTYEDGWKSIEDYVRNFFDKVRQMTPCILLIEQLDHLTNVDRLANQLLTEIDSIPSNLQIFFIATSTKPRAIDSTFLRPGRFFERIYVPYPDSKTRLAILHMALKQRSIAEDTDLTLVAQILYDYSSADILEMCQKLKAQSTDTIQREHFEQVFRQFSHPHSNIDQSVFEDERIASLHLNINTIPYTDDDDLYC